MAGNRILKINSEIQKTLASIIAYKLKDPRLENVFVSVLNVDTSQDLSYCKVRISVFPNNKEQQTLNIIKSSVPFIRKEIAKQIRIRIIPEFHFSLDDGINFEDRISQLLKENKNNGSKN